jgi:hypothetical protein
LLEGCHEFVVQLLNLVVDREPVSKQYPKVLDRLATWEDVQEATIVDIGGIEVAVEHQGGTLALVEPSARHRAELLYDLQLGHCIREGPREQGRVIGKEHPGQCVTVG